MARQSAGELILRTAIRGVVYYLVYRTMEKIWHSEHPILYSALLIVGLALLYAVWNS